MENDCIFCKLIEDKHNIYNDDICYAKMDKYPSGHGHLLVISKKHHENILVTPDDTVSHMFLVAKRLGIKLKEKLGSDGIVISTNTGKEAGQIIFHFHIHVIPKYVNAKEGFVKHQELTEKEEIEFKKLLSN
ncbi:MAG: HIT domain-containing protein [Candidatus Micrarchaeaceae archaeon]|jgi:histidine triad (HIT) family protein